jgi:hypothetical protein
MIEKLKEKEKPHPQSEPQSEKKARSKKPSAIPSNTNNFIDCFEYMHSKRKKSLNLKKCSSGNSLNFLSKGEKILKN